MHLNLLQPRCLRFSPFTVQIPMLLRSFPPLQVLEKALRRANVNSRYGDSWNKYSDSNAQECEAKNWASVEACTEKAKADVKIQDEKPKGDSVLLRFGFLQEV